MGGLPHLRSATACSQKTQLHTTPPNHQDILLQGPPRDTSATPQVVLTTRSGRLKPKATDDRGLGLCATRPPEHASRNRTTTPSTISITDTASHRTSITSGCLGGVCWGWCGWVVVWVGGCVWGWCAVGGPGGLSGRAVGWSAGAGWWCGRWIAVRTGIDVGLPLSVSLGVLWVGLVGGSETAWGCAPVRRSSVDA